MQRVKFITVAGLRTVIEANNENILLSYFMADHQFADDVQESIQELQTVQSGHKTFEEVFTHKYGVISIGTTAGEFECDKDTAYFISNNPDLEPGMEMPLQEFIDLLHEWNAFLEA